MGSTRVTLLTVMCWTLVLCSWAEGQEPVSPKDSEATEAAKKEMMGTPPPPFDKEKHLQELRKRLEQSQPEIPDVVLTPAEKIVQECRTADGIEEKMAALQKLLQRDDLSDELRIYAWWRIGAMYSYNSDPAKGWPYDPDKAAEAFRKALAVRPELVSFETTNAAITLATMPGKPMQRAERFAEGYRWLRTRTPEMVEKSAQQLGLPSTPEGILGAKFFPGVGKQVRPPDERRLALAGRLEKSRTITEKWLPYFIKNEDPVAVSAALAKVEDVAPPKKLAAWRRMLQLDNRWTDITQIIDERVGTIEDVEVSVAAGQDENNWPEHGQAKNAGTIGVASDVPGTLGADILLWLMILVVAEGGLILACVVMRRLRRRRLCQ